MEESEGGDVPRAVLDDAFSVLAHEHRRRVFDYLHDQGGVALVEDLIDAVAEPNARPSGPGRGRVEVCLHHEHLPVLAEKGFVEYDPETGVVTSTDRADRVEPLLAITRDVGSPDVPGETPTS